MLTARVCGIGISLLLGLTASGCSLEDFLVDAKYTEIRAEPLVLEPNWQTLAAEEPLQATKRKQSILLEIQPPIEADTTTWSLRLPDGSHAVPEVTLIGTDGQQYPLSARSFLGSTRYKSMMLVCSGDRFARGTTFWEVRVRSSQPVTITRVVWLCSNPN